jgi:hypothetical protein
MILAVKLIILGIGWLCVLREGEGRSYLEINDQLEVLYTTKLYFSGVESNGFSEVF